MSRKEVTLEQVCDRQVRFEGKTIEVLDLIDQMLMQQEKRIKKLEKRLKNESKGLGGV